MIKMKNKTVSFVFCSGVLIVILFGIFFGRGYDMPNFRGQVILKNHVTLEAFDKETGELVSKEEISLPAILKLKPENEYVLSDFVDYQPKSFESPYCFVGTSQLFVKAKLDGEVLYKYEQEDMPNRFKTPGEVYPVIPLPKDCGGKELKLYLNVPDGVYLKSFVTKLVFGDYPSLMRICFNRDIPNIILTSCGIFSGILLIIFSLCMSVKPQVSNRALKLGCFAIAFGVFQITHIRFLYYMVGNSAVFYLIKSISFMLIPIPLLMFFYDKVLEKFRIGYKAFIGLFILNIAVSLLLGLLKIFDFRECYLVNIVLIVSSVVYVIFSYYVSNKKIKHSDNRDIKMTILSTAPIAGGIVLDIVFIVVTKFNHFDINTYFAKAGILVFLLVQGFELFNDMMVAYAENRKTEFYKDMAFRDALTGLENRASYIKEIEALEETESQKTDFNKGKNAIVCIDVNDLKFINDNFGHSAGDIAIKGTAQVIDSVFKHYGKCFRIGGDEFYAVLYNISDDIMKKLVSKVKEETENFNKNSNVKISFALGYQIIEKDMTVKSATSFADKNMYVDKAKAKHGAENIR